MNHKIKIEIAEQSDQRQILAEILENSGIGVEFTNHVAANIASKPQVDTRTLIKNTGINESTINILHANKIIRVSDLMSSFKSGFKNIKRLSKKNLDDINKFLIKNLNILKADFIPFCNLSNVAKKFLLKNEIFSLSQLRDMKIDNLKKIDGIKPAILCDIHLFFAELASHNHYVIITKKEKPVTSKSKYQSVVKQAKNEDFGGLLKIHGRTSTKNLNLSEDCKVWLIENNFTTLFSIIFEYELDFIKIRSHHTEDKFLLNKIIKEIKKYIFDISSITNKDYSVINLNLTREAKTALLGSKVYDAAKINEKILKNIIGDKTNNEKELIIMETMEILSQIINQDTNKKIGRKNEEEHTEIKKSKENDQKKKKSTGIYELGEEKTNNGSNLTLVPKEKTLNNELSNNEGSKTTNTILSDGMYTLESLDISKDVINRLHKNGIYFVDNIYQNEALLFRARGITKKHKQAIMDDISLFLSGKKSFEKKYLAHSILDLKLPHSINLALKKANMYYVEKLCNYSVDDLIKFKNIGHVSAEIIYTSVQLVKDKCNQDFDGNIG
jgi:hypothetical protein